MKISEVQDRFVEYYQSLGYDTLSRAPMLDESIPMSFVMSAGLVQVEQSLAKMQVRDKDKFVLVQDCFRHFDLERVGTDDIHLSIFKMPGAFKFGPNGKVETVERMWHLATSVLGIDKENIWASYFQGGRIEGKEFPEENIIKRAWKAVGLPDKRIVGLGKKDNFWLQGKGFEGKDEPRRSGPNTELFYDRGVEKACTPECRPGCKCGRFIEFSNSLFIRYEVDNATGEFRKLGDPFSETVIGIERVAMILQNRGSVFDIDCYRPILDLVQNFVNEDPVEEPHNSQSERIIADHLIALLLLVRDGAPPPGKNGRERIIKLLIRRVVVQQILCGISSINFLPQVLKCISDTLLLHIHYLVQQRVINYFCSEKERFLQTIDRGNQQLSKFIEENDGYMLSGEQVVFLEKRKGLSPMLIEKSLKEKGQMFPKSEYQMALSFWKEQSQN